jgi:hypothetical protein
VIKLTPRRTSVNQAAQTAKRHPDFAAKAFLGWVRPRDIPGQTRRRIAAQELADQVAVDAKLKKIKPELKTMVLERARRCSTSTASDRPAPPASWPR